jgi:3-hydroxyisobutyrate dehydrogenase
MRVAVLGTGIMGAPMARNLAAAGHEVTAWNRSAEKAEGIEGVTAAASVTEAVSGAEAVITMLADADAVEAVVRDALPALDGALLVQTSTIGLEATARLAEQVRGLVDAPVLGTKAPAEKGELIVIASGDTGARERCAPLFDAVGARTVALGDEPGASTRMKLVLNAWLVSLVEGLAESIALAEGLGVDPAGFLEIIDGGPLGPAYAKMKGTMMIERSYEPSFSLALAAKDARLALDAADASGLELPALRAIRAQLEKAVEQGHGDADMAAAVEASRPG